MRTALMAVFALSLGLKYSSSLEQIDVHNYFATSDTFQYSQMYKMNIKSKGYGIFIEYAVGAWRFREIFTPLAGLSVLGRQTTSEILNYSSAAGDYVEIPPVQTNAVLHHTDYGFILGMDAELHAHWDVFFKMASETVWHNLLGTHQDVSEGLRTQMGIALRI